MSMLLKHRDAPIPDLSSFLADTTPELALVFQRMVAKAPEERYQTMTEVVRELERLQTRIIASNTQTQPPSAQPAAPMNLLNRPVVSNQTAAGTLGDTSTFDVTPGVAAQTVLQPGRVAGLTIVLVEPSRTQAGIIRRYLTQFGAGAVHATGSGREGIEIAKRERADVLICSMHLSDMTGAALARTLVADPGCGRLGVVVATSESDAEYATELPSELRVKVLPKPFDFQQLTRAITSVIV
jgi:CheY-like chemotaxis protein